MTDTTAPASVPRPPRARRPRLLRFVIIRLAAVAILLTTVIVAVVGYAVSTNESTLWRERQREGARSGAHGIASFLDRVEESLHYIALLGPEGITSAPAILREPLTRHEAFTEIVCVDQSGHITASSARLQAVLADPQSVPESPWFLQAKAGQPYRDAVLPAHGGDPYAVVATGSPGGMIVAARLTTGLLDDLLNQMDLGEHGRAYLSTREGLVIASTDKAILPFTSVLGRPEFQGLTTSSTGEWHGAYTNALGEPVQSAGHEVPESNWLVFLEFPQTETTAVSRSTILLLLAGFLTLAATITLAITHRLRADVFGPLEELRLGARAIGRGNLDHRLPPQPFEETDRLAETYNDMAVRLAEQRDALQRRAADLTAVYEVGLGLTADMDMQHVLHRVLEAAFKILPGIRHAHIFLLDGGTLNFAASLLADGRRDEQEFPLIPGGLSYQVASTGVPTYIPDTFGHPVFANAAPPGGLAVVPLAVGARVMGVLVIRHIQPHDYTEEEIHGLHLLADRIAVAIENAHLYSQIRAELARRRQSEAALSASECRYRAVVEDQTEGICRFTPAGVLTFINPALIRAYAFAGAIEVGMDFTGFLPPAARAHAIQRWNAYSPDNPRGDIEYRLPVPGGARWLAWTEHALFDGDGRLTEIQAVAHDVTAARQAQEQIRQMNADLEKRVAARTAELAQANDSLQTEIAERERAQAQISASLHEKELLLKEIHHRVKNNLQVIASLLSLQAGGAQDPAAREMLRESQNRVRSMALIHEELYRGGDLARVAFSRYLSGLTAQLVRTYRTVSHSAELVLEVDDDVAVDLDRAIPCGLIVNELVTNALKYAFTNGRPGRLLVSLTRYPGNLLRLTVADDGPGLPAGLDWRNTETLGLQLVTTLAEQLGGTVTLDQSEGAAFSIIFPGSAGETEALS